jgi:hypothetical protein
MRESGSFFMTSGFAIKLPLHAEQRAGLEPASDDRRPRPFDAMSDG